MTEAVIEETTQNLLHLTDNGKSDQYIPDVAPMAGIPTSRNHYYQKPAGIGLSEEILLSNESSKEGVKHEFLQSKYDGGLKIASTTDVSPNKMNNDEKANIMANKSIVTG